MESMIKTGEILMQLLISSRFGTAKRLKQIMDLREEYFSNNTIKDLKLLNPIDYILTFGNAKPTGAL